MGNNFLVQIRNGDKIKYDSTSKLAKLPHSILQNNIFPFLTAYDLFKIRGVSKGINKKNIINIINIKI